MSTAVPLREDETILAEDKVLRLVGPLGQHGEVVLTNQRVMFVPTGRLDRLVGASQCAMDVDQMISLEVKGLDRVVVLETKADSLRLSGAGAHRLYERLQSLLAERTGESGRFEVGERILVQGSLDVFIKAVLSTKGEVVLTDRRLRISCRGGIETLLFKGRDLDVRLSEIDEVSIEGIQRLLHVRVGKDSHVLGGALIHKLFAFLHAVGTGEVKGEDATIQTHFEASVFRGPLAVAGLVVVNASDFSFTPTGALDSMVGARHFRLSISSLRRAEVRGWPDRRLVLSMGREEHVFGLEEILERFEDINQVLRRKSPKALPGNGGRLNVTNTGKLFKKWKVKPDEGESILLTEWSLHWFDDAGVRMGWLCLTDKRVLFLPVRAEGVAEKAVSYRGVVRIGGQLNELGYLSFSSKAQTHRFSPSGGRDFVVRFWQDCKTEDKIVDQRETRGGQPVSRLLGDVRFIRLMREDDEIVYLKPAYLSAGDKGIMVEIGRAGSDAMPVGQPLVAEVGRTEGLYRFDCQVVELENDGPAGAGRTRLILTQTGDICFYNRRASYRVDAAYEVEVRPVGKAKPKDADGEDPDVAKGRLYDLSIGGCRVALMAKLQVSGRVSLTMPLGDGKVQVLARVIHCQGPTETRETRLYGMSFQRLSEVNRIRINQEVMRRDRALLRQRAQVKA